MKYKVPPVVGFAAAADALVPDAKTVPTARNATAAEAIMRRLDFKPDICPPIRRILIRGRELNLKLREEKLSRYL
jgi:hypothetical protein